MQTWQIQVHLTRPIPDQQGARDRLPDIRAFGYETTHQRHSLYFDEQADTRAEAIEAVRVRVETALGADLIESIGGADDIMQERQIMLWVRGTRRQVRRWEGALAVNIRALLANDEPLPWDIWDAQIEKHLALVAANNLLRAVANADGRFTPMTDAMATDIRNQRDLHEHWDEQMPAFYNAQTPGPLKRGGVAFAARHPGRSPFSFLDWNSADGPRLGPGVAVNDLHDYLDGLENEVLACSPDFSRFVSDPEPSPWVGAAGGTEAWWPLPRADVGS